MAVLVPGTIRKVAARPQVYGPGRGVRKIGIVGTYSPTLWCAPWSDPSWEFWGNTSAYNKVPPGRLDMLIDTHPKFCFMEARKNGFKDYFEFLKRSRTPILMQNQYEDIPASVRYPREQILTEFPHLEYKSMTAELIAYAILIGATDLGFWGVEYGHDTEKYDGQRRFYQRDNCRMWVGIAYGRGLGIHTPPGCTLLEDSNCKERGYRREDYGFDLTVEKYAADKDRQKEAMQKTQPFAPSGLKDLNTPEEHRAAHETRMADPDFAREYDKMKHEVMPDEFLSPEDAAQRRARVQADIQHATDLARRSAGAVAVHADGAVSGGGWVPEGPASAAAGAGTAGHADADAENTGSAAQQGDGAVQSPVPAGADGPVDAGGVRAGHRTSRRPSVARQRRPTGRGGAGAGVHTRGPKAAVRSRRASR